MSSTEPESLDAILQAENPPLQSVLGTPSFVQAVKTCHPQLNAYLLSDNIFPEVLNIALTDKAASLGYTAKMISNTMLFLTTNSNETQQKFSENPLFLNVIKSFPDTEYARQPKIAGNFQRILDSIVHRTNGQYLSNLPNISKFLIDNLNILAYSELWITLTTEFMLQFGVDLNLIKMFAQTVGGPNGFTAVASMKQMLKLKKDLFNLFDTVDVVEILLQEVIKPGNPLLLFKLFQVLEKINSVGKDPQVKATILSYGENFNFEEHTQDFIRASAISLFKVFPDEYINRLFDDHPFSSLNSAIIKAISSIGDKKLIELNTKYNLIDRILNNPISKTNPYVWSLAELLYVIPSLITPSFREFKIDIVDPHVLIRSGAFGGERPRDESSDYGDPPEHSAPFVSLDIEILSDSSSSDTSSDEENDIGGFENARFFAKLAGMDDLVEDLNEQQKQTQRSE
ncbi:hypothetical protein TVAG_369970 [Trichomonas vaginalis G3]|uniref:Uncharacterized protein n=1 Tax=Trichomonas vaginalis (strain ATCC PRA-98 / G3) TaxID=412133 RepID=A2EX49_TRIV3|nr:hypothetical protein TVAGG3_0860050 [Trichomonas vaginalis G3]EAY02769.1 hypothetical protein TVAG_369970 [Trichomonas vaginalis G3]KAI5500603.1 hypothetical protein TVAGG3_0860050 [Trichomonas vaginalis G3]|eukprot:XP_001314992.1 hypothetical protein [Trichomonas vaginalis G3]